MSDETPRPGFRVLSRTREGYNGSTMFDVQLQSIRTGNLLWARTFTDRAQALAFQAEVEADLDDLSDAEFRRKHGIPSED